MESKFRKSDFGKTGRGKIEKIFAILKNRKKKGQPRYDWTNIILYCVD